MLTAVISPKYHIIWMFWFLIFFSLIVIDLCHVFLLAYVFTVITDINIISIRFLWRGCVWESWGQAAGRGCQSLWSHIYTGDMDHFEMHYPLFNFYCICQEMVTQKDYKATDVWVTAMNFYNLLVSDGIIFKHFITLLTFELNIFNLTLITFITCWTQRWPIFFCNDSFIVFPVLLNLSASISMPSLTVIVSPNDPDQSLGVIWLFKNFVH